MREVRVEPGGQVATALTTCTRLGLDSTLHRIGRQPTTGAKEQLASLRRENLELHVREVEGAASQVAVIVLEEGIGERTILWRRDPAVAVSGSRS